VVTVPPTLAGRLEYDPPLPSWRDQLPQRMPAGSVIKTYARIGPAWPTARRGVPEDDRPEHEREVDVVCASIDSPSVPSASTT
jgi:hypothetical protein